MSLRTGLQIEKVSPRVDRTGYTDVPTVKTPAMQSAEARARNILPALAEARRRLRQIPPFDLALYGMVAAIVLLGAVMRAYHLGVQSLWIDELAEGSAAQLNGADFFVRVRTHSGATPLDYLGVKLVTSIFGYSTIATRLWAYLLGCLSVYLMYLVGSALFKSKTVGLVAALMLALSAYHIYYSQEARYYALWVFMALVSLYFFHRALEGRTLRDWLVFAVVVALTFYSGYFLALLVVLEGLYLFAYWLVRVVSARFEREVLREGVRQVAWGAGAFVLGFVLFLPWFVFAFFQQASTPWNGSFSALLPPLTFRQLALIFTTLFTTGGSLATRTELAVTLLVGGLAALGLALSIASRRLVALILAAAAALAVPFAWTVDVRSHYFWSDRQAIFIVPLVYLLAGAGVGYMLDALAHWLGQRNSQLGETAPETASSNSSPQGVQASASAPEPRGAERARFVSRAAILASVVVFGLVWAAASRQSVSRVYASAFIPKEDWRGATSFVAARVCPTSHIYSVVAGNMDFGVGYYDPALMHRSQWVSIAPGYYDGSLTDVVAKVKYYGHDWYVLFNNEESFMSQGPGTVNTYLTQHGWQFTQFQGLVVYYQPGPC